MTKITTNGVFPALATYDSPHVTIMQIDGEGPIMGASSETYNQREDYEGEWA